MKHKPTLSKDALIQWLISWYEDSDGRGPSASTLILNNLTLGQALQEHIDK